MFHYIGHQLSTKSMRIFMCSTFLALSRYKAARTVFKRKKKTIIRATCTLSAGQCVYIHAELLPKEKAFAWREIDPLVIPPHLVHSNHSLADILLSRLQNAVHNRHLVRVLLPAGFPHLAAQSNA